MALKIGNGLDLQSQKIVNLADPSSLTDAATKQYVDNGLLGLRWKAPVRVATTTNGTLATAFANGQTIDGVVLVTGDRILLKDQTTQTDNGIYTVNVSGVPTRSTDANTSALLLNATVFVVQGTVNADKAYNQTTNATGGGGPVIGTDNIVWVQFGAGQAYTAGNGLQLASTTFSVLANGTSIDVSASGVKIADAAAGNGLAAAAGILSVNTGTGLEINSDNVRIATTAAGTGLTGGGGSALSIDTSIVAKVYTGLSGAVTGGSALTVNHALNKQYVVCQVYIAGTGEQVLPDVFLVDANNLTLTFATSQSANFYRIVVVG